MHIQSIFRLVVAVCGTLALASPEYTDELDFDFNDLTVRSNQLEARSVEIEQLKPFYHEYIKRSSPTGTYTPGQVACPRVHSLVRNASSGLSFHERSYIEGRQAETSPYLITYLDRLNLTDFNATEFLADTNITISIAYSGGGYRAMLSGAGSLSAFDDRTPNATDPGHVGGLLQSATYITGLSGGSWLVSSLAVNNNPTIGELVASDNVWDLSDSIFNPGGWAVWATASYYDDMVHDVDGKKDAGFNVSLTDYWGRGLSNQLFNYSDGGPAVTFSDIRNLSSYKAFDLPYPIIVTDGRPYNTDVVSLNSTVYEISPFELGSWDPSLYAFADLRYIGTNMTNGVPNNSTCIEGFDNAGFMMGTSATLFNQFLLQINSTGIEGVLYDAVRDILTDISNDENDIAPYAPNPFYGVNPEISYMANETILTLVDGGEDFQNIPLAPLIQPIRHVDVIFAMDNSADTNFSWPSGWSMTATYDRQFSSQGNGTVFPAVPDQNTFVGLNLTARPTWFGCDASNITGKNGGTDSPLIVYMANRPISYFSNTSTFKMSYETDEVEGMITNGYNIATQGNGTLDDEWSKCIGCAIIHREVERRNQTPTAECQACLTKYCWDGTVLDQNASASTQDPDISVDNGSDSNGSSNFAYSTVHSGGSSWWTVLLICVVAAVMV
ncbi:lysophospholipase catalytic domain-containing protein [Lipomyces arxii]|uniref:lysophospholipase catalytic domain-containing protein n=1 Tax=Lipomyces arxii TaxID=56418 RepID=UPI0034CF07D7